ncbi:pimeloyl-ACP methyl ester esterase BioH [Neptunomonas antarctica]|uniref:Pimeloyl-[acyl-carrier protein] methyl ester esterase n=1 Tax=Neptunomonas antarctica TaxID=619304 RepID=A0A1N7JG01_9GAMM|nr:pimeloyl-ACP methyl ester esterase BioH [Neptunomonas antarctica]SIS48166.1 pimeloyl-[acyl-carrier protein] methyl ester esterase [Neptunomonas antarctica]
MAIYHQSFGSTDNPELVLLHGWGMSSAIWQTLMSELTMSFYVTLIDLPGLGRSAGVDSVKRVEGTLSLDSIAEQVAAVVKQPAYWLGWSLGGLIATQIAVQYPEKVKGLITVASNPCFVQKTDWPSAMERGVYAQFKEAVAVNPEKALMRFAMLQVQGSEAAKPLLKQIKAVLAESQPTHLLETLTLLENDIRERLSQLRCPVLHIYGAADQLVPVCIVSAVAELSSELSSKFSPAHQIVCFESAGHLPFLSHPEAFMQSLLDFTRSAIIHG